MLSKIDAAPDLLSNAFLSGELPDNAGLLPLSSAYAISLWILQGKHSGDGYGFPFDRPLLSFAERLLEGKLYVSVLSAHWRPKLNGLLIGSAKKWQNK